MQNKHKTRCTPPNCVYNIGYRVKQPNGRKAKMLNQKIKLLESNAEVAETDAEVVSIFDEITALIYENGTRIENAKQRFYKTSDEAQYQGNLNVGETAPFSNFVKYGKQAELECSCEFWEMSADSAESWEDFRV
jgi:hypothetical protein